MSEFVPLEWRDQEEHRRKLAQALNLTIDGKINSVSEITLTENSLTTVIDDQRVGLSSYINFMPLTANALTEHPNIRVSNIDTANRQFTISHSNNSQTDRDYRYVVLG